MISKMKIIAVILGIVLFSSQAFAVSTSWTYSDYSHGSYVPKTGTMYYYNYFHNTRNRYILETDVNFKLDSNNVTNILDYNNGGDNPGTEADNKNCYLTLDQTSIPENTVDLEISGFQVATNLPDPKIDLEINYVGVDEIQAQFAMSAKGVSDYNNVVQSNVIQATMFYGDKYGQQ